MIKGVVVGSIVSTVKDAQLKGLKLLVVRLDGAKGNAGPLVVATDTIGTVGNGDEVYIVQGKESAMAINSNRIPLDMGIAGIVD